MKNTSSASTTSQKKIHPAIKRARIVANLMDSVFVIPVINKKIGLDPLIGAFPIWGDLLSFAMGGYIIWVAIQLKMPMWVVVKMLANSLLDVLVGMIPVLGDLTDAWLKSNQRNVILLEEAYERYGGKPSASEEGVVIDVNAF
jgi:hypothetical protein